MSSIEKTAYPRFPKRRKIKSTELNSRKPPIDFYLTMVSPKIYFWRVILNPPESEFMQYRMK
ncbi:TPA: hypothetical protein RJD83_002629 [Legionella pneumophila]|nr:hypothetical protein [Legionella pneumophila]